jgi:hypothetical protein
MVEAGRSEEEGYRRAGGKGKKQRRIKAVKTFKLCGMKTRSMILK